MEIKSLLGGLISRDNVVDGRGECLIIPSVVGPILAGLLVFNRVFWRMHLVKEVGYDDVCIIFSMVFLFAQCCVNLVGVNYGYGLPAESLEPVDLQHALLMFFLGQVFYKLTINLTKLSILALYLRIFSQRWFRTTCLICVTVVASYGTASFFVSIFQCSPVKHFWHRTILGHCINTTAFWMTTGIYNIITDFFILTSVPPMIWSLKLPVRQKIGLTLIFGLGTFVFVTSVLRLTTLDRSSKSHDITYGTLKSTMWTTIESTSAVTCACFPMLRTPMVRLFPRLMTTCRANTDDDKKIQNDKKPTAQSQARLARTPSASRIGSIIRDPALTIRPNAPISLPHDIEKGKAPPVLHELRPLPQRHEIRCARDLPDIPDLEDIRALRAVYARQPIPTLRSLAPPLPPLKVAKLGNSPYPAPGIPLPLTYPLYSRKPRPCRQAGDEDTILRLSSSPDDPLNYQRFSLPPSAMNSTADSDFIDRAYRVSSDYYNYCNHSTTEADLDITRSIPSFRSLTLPRPLSIPDYLTGSYGHNITSGYKNTEG